MAVPDQPIGWFNPEKPHKPHNNKRRPPTARQKRVQVSLDDGWTVVTSSSTTTRIPTEGTSAHAHPKLPQEKGLTVQKLQQEYERYRELLRASECARTVEAVLKRWQREGEGSWGIDTAVCVGLGQLSVEAAVRRRAMWQLVLFLHVVESLQGLGGGGGERVKMFAQEPNFTALDEEFLKGLGVEVVTHPRGAEMVTERTFLYAPFLPWFVLLRDVLPGKDPRLYVGIDVNEVQERMELQKGGYGLEEVGDQELEECSQVAKKFLEGRQRVRVGEFEGERNALEGLWVYWREVEEG
ncbi:hypothetical protein LTS18_007452 [Coniosporium uncinatum]|uniref:Uncharacterized protein n=1 Tax=Coniosporium uncinatum TaxID=93489 RepID=A0ACC3DP16_9PEZI|nr:hypothetical protein LTS18_007452 [Coniosporium uncinatum]